MWISPSFALKGYPVHQVGQLTVGKAPDPPKHFILDGVEYRGIRRDTQHSERTQKSHQRSIPNWGHLCENNKIIVHRPNTSLSVTSDFQFKLLLRLVVMVTWAFTVSSMCSKRGSCRISLPPFSMIRRFSWTRHLAASLADLPCSAHNWSTSCGVDAFSTSLTSSVHSYGNGVSSILASSLPWQKCLAEGRIEDTDIGHSGSVWWTVEVCGRAEAKATWEQWGNRRAHLHSSLVVILERGLPLFNNQSKHLHPHHTWAPKNQPDSTYKKSNSCEPNYVKK